MELWNGVEAVCTVYPSFEKRLGLVLGSFRNSNENCKRSPSPSRDPDSHPDPDLTSTPRERRRTE